MTPLPLPNGFLRRWILSCAAGELVGIGAAAAIAVGFHAWMGEPVTTAGKIFNLLVMLLAGAIEGTTLGWLQWRVLRELFPSMPLQSWMGMTALIAVLGWLLGMGPAIFLQPSAQPLTNGSMVEPPLLLVLAVALGGGLLLGALFGLFQWVALRRHAARAWLWIPANALGWGLAMGLIFLSATLPDAATPAWKVIAGGILGGIAAGLAVGWVTGIFLRRIYRHGRA